MVKVLPIIRIYLGYKSGQCLTLRYIWVVYVQNHVSGTVILIDASQKVSGDWLNPRDRPVGAIQEVGRSVIMYKVMLVEQVER